MAGTLFKSRRRLWSFYRATLGWVMFIVVLYTYTHLRDAIPS